MEYYFMRCGDTTKNVPFKVIEEHEHFVDLELVRYPSYYGMSRPYRESAMRHDLIRPRTADDVIRWVENSKDYKDTVNMASTGNQWAQGILREWKEIKRGL